MCNSVVGMTIRLLNPALFDVKAFTIYAITIMPFRELSDHYNISRKYGSILREYNISNVLQRFLQQRGTT